MPGTILGILQNITFTESLFFAGFFSTNCFYLFNKYVLNPTLFLTGHCYI